MTVSAEARRVYDAIGAYAWAEAVAWPSQARIASELGCTREHVNRKVAELERAGWLTIAKRPGFSGWLHNVYELLEAFMPATRAFIRRVVARAKRRQRLSITLTGSCARGFSVQSGRSATVRALAHTYGVPLLL